ncbi:MAG: hypothetical protein IAE80_18970 [Anaerolinea sp.]|nr:hypothetical protein [Anaerolinea sp.]
MTTKDVPTPDLRIVATASLQPHEEHDTQRSAPLIESLKSARYMINPPLVSPMSNDEYVILDGANRAYCFSQLDYPHLLVQVTSYNGGLVELDNWQHVVGGWNIGDFIGTLRELPEITVSEGENEGVIAHLYLRDNGVLSIHAPAKDVHERNAALRKVVAVYQQNAALHRTTLSDPDEVWSLYPDGIALVIFPRYQPADIIEAAQYRAYLPPGISRHIVNGRAIRVNYPLEYLRDPGKDIHEKNVILRRWLQEKLASRQIRYYAEGTYQFDE